MLKKVAIGGQNSPAAMAEALLLTLTPADSGRRHRNGRRQSRHSRETLRFWALLATAVLYLQQPLCSVSISSRRDDVLFEHGEWRCKDTRHGLAVFSRGREDLVSRSLDLLGQYSEKEVRLFRSLIKANDTVLDVGANFGGLSLPFARLVEGGRVHAFEPHAKTAAFLRATLALNGLLDSVVVVHQLGVGNVSGELDLVTVDGNSGVSYLEAGGEAARDRSWAAGRRRRVSRVPVAALDDLALDGLDRLKLLKIDAEGHDLAVLQGARRMVQLHRPWVYVEMEADMSRVASYFEASRLPACPSRRGGWSRRV
jgi:FkbM family methyltransferase